ncbi:hypothetical protein M0R72_12985 [Candidatus Pacearchaeota archaeon]|jgi:hypothetical protein|nr:hypothetical protein [Candidatus Pacearchaeota archaeon]
MSNLTIKVDTVDVTAYANLGTFKLNFKRNDFNTLRLAFENSHFIPATPNTVFVIEVLLGAVNLFTGQVMGSNLSFQSNDTHTAIINAVDYNALSLLYSVMSFDFSAGDHNDKQILTDIFTTFSPNPITTHVIDGSATSIVFTDSSLRRMLDDLANANSRFWYWDADKELHWFANTGETAPFGLSDTPNNTTTFKYGELRYKVDKNGILNVTGGSLVCWQDGLRAGMAIAITNSHLSWAAQTFIINEVEMTVVDKVNGIYEYFVSFGDVPKPRITDYIQRSNKGVSTVDRGLVQTLENDTGKFYRSDGTWNIPAAGMTDPLTERGSIIYRGASAPAELKHSDTGKYLETHGDGADPLWSYIGSHTTQAIVTGSRTLGTEYQNTSGKTMIVTVTVSKAGGTGLTARIKTSSPADTYVITNQGHDSDGGTIYTAITVVVPPGYYYKIDSTSASTLEYWTEWTLG